MGISAFVDFGIVTQFHFILFVIVFIISFVIFSLLVRWFPARSLAAQDGSAVRFGGIPLVCIMTATASFVLGLSPLAVGLWVSAILVAIAGYVDERYPLSPLVQLVLQLIAVGIVVGAGWTVPYVSNPFGSGVLMLDWVTAGTLLLPGSIIAVVWLLVIINAFNWLDGVDGLAGGVACVAFAALAFISLIPSIQRPDLLALSMIGLGGVLSFFLWNFPHAKVYLGTVGSWFVGLYIGLVSMYGGGKIATTTLILALPLLDALFVIIQRVMKHQALWKGDTVHHLHHRLQTAGWSPTKITISAICVTVILAILGMLLSTTDKLVVMVALVSVFALLLLVLMRYKRDYV